MLISNMVNNDPHFVEQKKMQNNHVTSFIWEHMSLNNTSPTIKSSIFRHV